MGESAWQKAIETAAEALYRAVLTDSRPHHPHPEWENTSETVRNEYRRLARAGVTAFLARESGAGIPKIEGEP
jgi:hypothetical protein